MKILFALLIIGLLIFAGCTQGPIETDPVAVDSNVDANFVIFVLPDTQNYSEHHPDIFLSQTNWIKENFDDYNAVLVIHEGDMVNHWNNEKEWQNASVAMQVLIDGNVPFLLIPGNHDHNNYFGSAEFYSKYFPISVFENMNWYKGNIGDNTSNYGEIRIGGRDFVFLGIDVCPDEDEIAWANNIFSQNENKHLILVTHGYLNEKAERIAGVCKNTQYIWDDLIKNHKNLNLTLSGHMHGQNYRIDPNDYNKDVIQMLADYQTMENGGNGYLRILTFVPSQDKIVVDTYSPYLDKQLDWNGSKFVLDYDFDLN